MGGHALVNFGGSEHQDNGTHSRKVINAKLTRPVVGCSFDLASLNKGYDDRLFAVWSAFFHVEPSAYWDNLSSMSMTWVSVVPAKPRIFSAL